MKTPTAFSLVLLSLCGLTANATVTFDWATVGNPRNGPDQLYPNGNPDDLLFGAVANVYRISKHEVTNDQYAEFLNNVAASDPNGLFSPAMDISRSGNDGSYIYMVNAGFGPNPVNEVSFFDAMRFVNWLENGQGSGSTESGVYTISDGRSETRAPGARFLIPSEHEWYKAAYYDPRPAAEGGPPGDDNYWLYPTQSDTAPSCVAPPGAANSANCDFAVGDTTDVGAYTYTTNFYGTFDQGGNVYEWNEAVTSYWAPLCCRGLRGGSWDDRSIRNLAASNRESEFPSLEDDSIGFRVASIPEPSTGLLGVLATVGLLMRGRTVS